jgi:drug/metabolite transporter (DMT)-like permease
MLLPCLRCGGILRTVFIYVKMDRGVSGVRKEHHLAGQGAVFFCAVLWSTSGLFIKLINWHPVVIAGVRSFLAALFLLLIRIFFRKKPGTGPGKIRHIAAGGLAYAATMLSFVIANKLTASANAILLQYTAPVWASILGWLLIREKPRWEHWGALVMVMGGLFLFFRDGLAGGAFPGDSLALLSGFFFGANSVFMRMQKEGNPADSMLLAHVICAAVGLPFVFLYPPALNPANTAAIVFMGIIQIGVASLLFSFGIKRIRALEAMLIAMAEPVLNPLWVLLITGEKPSPPALLGGSVIIAAVLFSSIISKGREKSSL